MRRRIVLVFIASMTAATSSAWADESLDRPRVSLVLDDCVPAERAEVRRVFAVELATSLPGARLSDGEGATLVRVGCEGKLLLLGVEDPVTGKSLSRRIDLSSTEAKARERLLALAMMELVVASWIELEATPDPVAPVAEPRANLEARLSARRLVRRRLPAPSSVVTTSVLGTVEWNEPGLSYGGGLRVVMDNRRGWGWGLDLLLQSAETGVSLGTVDVTSFSGGLSGHFHWRWRPATLRLGAGARLGAVTLLGNPRPGESTQRGSVTGLVGGPYARVALGIELWSRLSLEMTVEPGWHLFPVRGLVDGQDEVAVEGLWVMGNVAAGWVW